MATLSLTMLNLIQNQADQKLFMPYRPRIVSGQIKETKEFTDINGTKRTAKYALVSFLVHNPNKRKVGDFEIISLAENVAFTEVISELDGQHRSKFLPIAEDLIAKKAFDKFNVKSDEKGNESADYDLNSVLMLKFVDVKTDLYYATRWDSKKGENTRITNKAGEPVIRDTVRLMLEEGGEGIQEVYNRTYKRRVEPFLVKATAADATKEIPANTEFDNEGK